MRGLRLGLCAEASSHSSPSRGRLRLDPAAAAPALAAPLAGVTATGTPANTAVGSLTGTAIGVAGTAACVDRGPSALVPAVLRLSTVSSERAGIGVGLAEQAGSAWMSPAAASALKQR